MLDEQVLAEFDRLVRHGLFANRSKAIEEAVQDQIFTRPAIAAGSRVLETGQP